MNAREEGPESGVSAGHVLRAPPGTGWLGLVACHPRFSAVKLPAPQVVCWSPFWSPGHLGQGLEQVQLTERSADSMLLAFDEDGVPFRLTYRLAWDGQGRLLAADLEAAKDARVRRLELRSDGNGRWQDAQGVQLRQLDGCIDIDIWPTPLTNSFPLWRSPLQLRQRKEFLMAWVAAPDLTVQAKQQAYTRLADRLYLFESLDGSGFKAELSVDEDGLITDYPGIFKRVS